MSEKRTVMVTIENAEPFKWCGKEFSKKNNTHEIPVSRPEDLSPDERKIYDEMIKDLRKRDG